MKIFAVGILRSITVEYAVLAMLPPFFFRLYFGQKLSKPKNYELNQIIDATMIQNQVLIF
jgi:hypothetical protein